MRIKTNVQQGFTLLELMIAVAIIGIIASIAVPNYIDYVKKGKASEATSNLADLRIKMEQCFQDNRNYTAAACAAFCAPTSSTSNFTYACSGVTPTTYTITATGAGSMTGFSFDVNEANDKNSTFDGNSGTGCWLTSKSGSC